ncbi:unnamed protein product [Heligmosomoides polygyrus]|uniref:Transposase n=1 Tax=Heligmosomoides polygyrus TaxID=6339 RepID=A0A183G9I5_HELPZ|nr:unnamed protein product [Heligmosomoides polygyrus]
MPTAQVAGSGWERALFMDEKLFTVELSAFRPAHRAKSTQLHGEQQAWYKANFLDFAMSAERPQHSSDLNPTDYSASSILKARVPAKRTTA